MMCVCSSFQSVSIEEQTKQSPMTPTHTSKLAAPETMASSNPFSEACRKKAQEGCCGEGKNQGGGKAGGMELRVWVSWFM